MWTSSKMDILFLKAVVQIQNEYVRQHSSYMYTNTEHLDRLQRCWNAFGFPKRIRIKKNILILYIYISIKIDVLRAPTFGEAVENRIWNQRTGVVLVQELKSLWRPPTVVKLSGTEILMMRMRNAVKEELETIGSWVHCFHTWVWSAFRMMIADKEHEDEDNDNKCLPA